MTERIQCLSFIELYEFNPKATKPCLVETTPFIIGLIWSRSRLERLVWISFWSSTLYLKLLPVDKISCEASSKQRICSFSTSCDHSLPAKLLHCQVLHDAARWKACCQVAWMPSSRECLEDEGLQQYYTCVHGGSPQGVQRSSQLIHASLEEGSKYSIRASRCWNLQFWAGCLNVIRRKHNTFKTLLSFPVTKMFIDITDSPLRSWSRKDRCM